jgi:hypothetical protein
MANAYFTFPALLVIYAAQRAIDLRARLAEPSRSVLPKLTQLGALRRAGDSA